MLDFLKIIVQKNCLTVTIYVHCAIMYFLRLFFDKFVYVPITKT